MATVRASTPTVDGERCVCLGASGDLICVDISTKSVRWHKNLSRDFSTQVPQYGYSESVLIDGLAADLHARRGWRTMASHSTRTAARSFGNARSEFSRSGLRVADRRRYRRHATIYRHRQRGDRRR